MRFFFSRLHGFRVSFALASALGVAALVPIGCMQGPGSAGESDTADDGLAPTPAAAINPMPPVPVKCPPEPACTSISPKAYRLSPSLVLTRNTKSVGGLTDDTILDANFQLHDVVDQLLSQAGTSGSQTPDEFVQRLWDTQNASAGVFNESYQPHCSDNGSTINGLPIDCPRPEGQLASNALTSDFHPIAVFNRFDLAPEDGGHCGEYRIIYAMENGTSGGVFGRNFIIFEGQLPNPTPQCGVESCRPVVDFWSSLSSMTNPTDIGDSLRKFYFDGLPGFSPVIKLQNYGFGAAGGGYGNSGGQIRTNQFVDFQLWQLREHQLDIGCEDATGCRLVTVPVTVKNNPFFDFFADPSGSISPAQANAFQSGFVANVGGQSQVSRLAVSHPNTITNLNLIAMDIDNKVNAGQSTSQGSSEAYLPAFQSVPTSAFHSGIQGELTAGGFALSTDQLVARSETQSCKGCHELSSGNPNIGGGLTWPNSLGFVHVDEVGDQSQALRCVFEPHRQAVGLGFLANCGANPAPIQSGDPDCKSFASGGGGYGGGKKAAADPDLVSQAKEAGAPSPVKTLGGGSPVN